MHLDLYVHPVDRRGQLGLRLCAGEAFGNIGESRTAKPERGPVARLGPLCGQLFISRRSPDLERREWRLPHPECAPLRVPFILRQ